MKSYPKYNTVLSAAFVVVVLASCKKLVTISTPPGSVNSSNVYNSDATAIGAVTNIYASMSTSYLPGGGITSMNLFPGLSADELSLYSGTTNSAVNYYYTNSLSSINLNSPDFWAAFYGVIFDVNAALEGISTSSGLTTGVKQQLSGEMLFMRAFCYFYLVNLYGDLPLVLTTNYTTNAELARTSKTIVYQQIIADLKSAESVLSQNYLDGTLLNATAERVRPTKWAACALLSRAYLYTGDYIDAEAQASAVIGNSSLFSLAALDSVFLKNSSEAIWQLQPVNAGWNTEDARIFILPASGPNATGVNSYYLSPQLLGSFENSDGRRTHWIDSVSVDGATYYYAFKYKSATFNNPVTEYEAVFRLSEQYLIRAEARAQQNKISDAQSDLDAIRSRAGLPGTGAYDVTTLLAAILHERQVELFTEWGHRWLDLKRTENVDIIMPVVAAEKGGTWNTDYQSYPISRAQLQLDVKLVQNAGYSN